MADRTYRLIVEGELSDELALAFPGMALSRADGRTELTGTMREQAELQGFPRRPSDFGLTLLEAKSDPRQPWARIPRRLGVPGCDSTCEFGGASGQATGTVTFTFSDISGAVDLSSVETS